MFEIVTILRKGWLGTKVVVRAKSAMKHRRKRLRFDRLWAPGLDAWETEVKAGEVFTVTLPPGGQYRTGQLLTKEALVDVRPVSERWRRVETL